MSPNTMIYAMLILVVSLNMCKNNQDNDSSTTLLYIILIGGIIFTLNNNNSNNNLINNSGQVVENLETNDNDDNTDNTDDADNTTNSNINVNTISDNKFENGALGESIELGDDKITLTADDLLPANLGSVFNHPTVPTTEGTEQFLDAGGIIGMLSQTLRNPNYDLRCAPANPKIDVGPWMQSTIDPDITRKPLEDESCGGCNSNNQPVPAN